MSHARLCQYSSLIRGFANIQVSSEALPIFKSHPRLYQYSCLIRGFANIQVSYEALPGFANIQVSYEALPRMKLELSENEPEVAMLRPQHNHRLHFLPIS